VPLNKALSVTLFGPNWATPPNINYTAPEIVVTRKCDGFSDIFSFGCIFYEMVTAKPIQVIKLPADLGAPTGTPRAVPPDPTVLTSEYFQTVPLRTLASIDKELREKFGFFKGLATVVHTHDQNKDTADPRPGVPR
jgi:serine/threonine protein kinase